jgi:hypothetical protein
MSLIEEYLKKNSSNYYEAELIRLISKYNNLTDSYLIVYASAISKSSIPDALMNMDDYFVIYDLLRNVNKKNLAFYIETPGGSGEAAEEISRCLRKKFENVNFVISGEAKSAGTILVMSGNEILMTQSGSLGPIDAQIQIGRYRVSAYDYINWIEGVQEKAEQERKLNPFDATIIAQISPGELVGVKNNLKFAEDLVVEWLAKYKFKNWTETETHKLKVTEEMKSKRANEIARELTNHGRWRSHGRSLKIEDLEELGLEIKKIDNDENLADIVYRIQTVVKLLFFSTTIYKIYATVDNKIFRNATQTQTPIILPPPNIQDVVVVNFDVKCTKCDSIHKLYAKLVNDPQIDVEQQSMGFKPTPVDNKLICECGYEIDLSGIKNEIESKTGKKIIY